MAPAPGSRSPLGDFARLALRSAVVLAILGVILGASTTLLVAGGALLAGTELVPALLSALALGAGAFLFPLVGLWLPLLPILGLTVVISQSLDAGLPAPLKTEPSAPASGQGTVRIERIDQYWGKLRLLEVWVDGEAVTTVAVGDTVDVPVDAGTREVMIKMDWVKASTQVVVAADQTVALEASSPLIGWKLAVAGIAVLFGQGLQLRPA